MLARREFFKDISEGKSLSVLEKTTSPTFLMSLHTSSNVRELIEPQQMKVKNEEDKCDIIASYFMRLMRRLQD